MTSSGHGTAAEAARVAELEAKLQDLSIDTDEQLELALLHLEPVHDGFRAVDLLQLILKSEPRHELARLWLAYSNVYELMDEGALQEAVGLADQVLESEASAAVKAAALLLKAAAFRGLGSQDPVVELQKSIELAPHWVANRQLLAKVFEERGDRAAAGEQLGKAIESAGTHREPMSLPDRFFEMLITARGSYRIAERLRDQIRQLRE